MCDLLTYAAAVTSKAQITPLKVSYDFTETDYVDSITGNHVG